jgi:hypothetical protein
MRQEILKFQHEEYLTITHKDSSPIDYVVPQPPPTDDWLGDIFCDKTERHNPVVPSSKRPLFIVDKIHNNDEEKYVENYGNPMCTVRKDYVMIVIERDGDKLALKLFYGGKTRSKGTSYFRIKKNVEYITVNTKTGDVYSGYLKGFQKKRNYSKKIRRNYFMESSLESMKIKIRNYLNVFKVEGGSTIAGNFINVFMDEIDKKQYDNLKIDDRLFKFYLDKRSIKYPNNFGVYKNHLIGPSIRKKLKKNGGKLVDAFMDEHNLQGKVLKKSLHECERIQLEVYNYAQKMFGADRLNQDSGVICSLLETLTHINFGSNLDALKKVMTHSEIDRYYRAFKQVFVNSNMDTYTLSDHVRMYLELKRYGVDVKWNSTNSNEFHNEHLDWTDKLSHYKNGTYTRIYPDILHELLSENIGEYTPILLTTSQEYNEESATQSNCVKGYIGRPESIIVSLRKDDERATIEYKLNSVNDVVVINRVQSLGKRNQALISKWDDVMLSLDKIMLSFLKHKNFELVKVIKENGMGMKISSDSKWVLTSWGSTQLNWENPKISNNNSFEDLFN